jgi:hypothetical protein
MFREASKFYSTLLLNVKFVNAWMNMGKQTWGFMHNYQNRKSHQLTKDEN